MNAVTSGNVLVVDDDRNILELLQMRLESANYGVTTALREDDALSAVREQAFDLSIIDLRLSQRDGISLMEEIRSLAPEMPVIILTAHGSIETAVEAMKKGAYGYLTKPFEPQDLLLHVAKGLENRRLASEVRRLKGLLEEKHSFASIVSRSESMQKVLEMVGRVAKTDSTICIYGESGTGKEVVAKALHYSSERRDRPFVAINCAALPESLLESELFGHERGSFTGAIRSTKGLFSQAHGGTIFLDEVGDMPLPIQAKLLRVLQERQFYPIGSERPVEVDVRIITASKKDLEEQVRQLRFREDLFYRVHVIPIYLPPLRERKEDIPPLVAHFLQNFSQQMKKEVRDVTPMAMQKLMMHDWPGNVRELENTIEYAVAMTRLDVITDELIFQPKKNGGPEPLKPLKEARDAFEKKYLIHLLKICSGRVSKAAGLAGKYRADFYDLLKKHDLKISDFKKTDA